MIHCREAKVDRFKEVRQGVPKLQHLVARAVGGEQEHIDALAAQGFLQVPQIDLIVAVGLRTIFNLHGESRGAGASLW